MAKKPWKNSAFNRQSTSQSTLPVTIQVLDVLATGAIVIIPKLFVKNIAAVIGSVQFAS